jgi:hypothetical protein
MELQKDSVYQLFTFLVFNTSIAMLCYTVRSVSEPAGKIALSCHLIKRYCKPACSNTVATRHK